MFPLLQCNKPPILDPILEHSHTVVGEGHWLISHGSSDSPWDNRISRQQCATQPPLTIQNQCICQLRFLLSVISAWKNIFGFKGSAIFVTIYRQMVRMCAINHFFWLHVHKCVINMFYLC